MSESRFQHIRHKPPEPLDRPRELVIICPSLRSRVNLSRIIRVAGCFGITRVIAGRPFTVDREIARDAIDHVEVESRGALVPVLKRLRTEGYHLVGLEQTTNSTSLFEYHFPDRVALLLGHERLGIPDDQLALVQTALEIPVYGHPLSFNVASAATMAIYEYCRQRASSGTEGR